MSKKRSTKQPSPEPSSPPAKGRGKSTAPSPPGKLPPSSSRPNQKTPPPSTRSTSPMKKGESSVVGKNPREESPVASSNGKPKHGYASPPVDKLPNTRRKKKHILHDARQLERSSSIPAGPIEPDATLTSSLPTAKRRIPTVSDDSPSTKSPTKLPTKSASSTQEIPSLLDEGSLDTLQRLLDSGDLEEAKTHVARLREGKVRSERGDRPEEDSLELAPHEELRTVRHRRRKKNLRTILYDPDFKPRLTRFLDLLRSGVSMQAAAGQLGVRSDTIYVWYRRGEQEGKGPYRRMYRLIHEALQMATAVAEGEVKSANPLTWLKQGPGRLINESWAVPESMNLQVVSAQNAEDQIVVPLGDITAALAKLRDAGIDRVGDIVDGQVLDAENIDEFGEDGDRVSKRGTNYAENGKWDSQLPCIPNQLIPVNHPSAARIPDAPRPRQVDSHLDRNPGFGIPEGVVIDVEEPLQVVGHPGMSAGSSPPDVVNPGRPMPIDQELYDATEGQIVRPKGIDPEPTPGLTSARDKLKQLLLKLSGS